ncbi:DDHD-domain-containing protein [Myriangium duriaei CBS 260.36]|uniref:DDHD-domain-containing protein n=1 Tax=Myriangium duriaei CBS 260.36 TaxID=1168546 RepID=A0A9P4J8I5_9PEZI|nr:DDHD-domain-containing protein [Myriangium duriaei CBS 260.36]
MSNSQSQNTAGKAAGGHDGTTNTSNDGDIAGLSLQPQRGGDHRIGHRRGPSLRAYPPDCPPLKVQWFFAVDVPKRKPKMLGGAPTGTEETKTQPKKYAPFSNQDSRSIEAAFQKSADRDDDNSRPKSSRSRDFGGLVRKRQLSDASDNEAPSSNKVYVNEDFLFDVDIEKRELEPAYWLGPVYEVRRGSWFHQEGSTQRPCDENLANQLEEGFLKLAPWRFTPPRSTSQPRPTSKQESRPRSIVETAKASISMPVSPKLPPADTEDGDGKTTKDVERDSRSRQVSDPAASMTHRLFGPYSNSMVTYQDATTAWILTDDFMSRMSGTVYQRFAGGSHFAGMKVTRGYVDSAKKGDTKESKLATAEKKEGHEGKEDQRIKIIPADASEEKRRTLERHMSSLVSSATQQNAEQQEEEVRQRDEREIQDDYKDHEGEDQNRPIEHLLLVTHGIGQRLGLRLETVNFVHDVNSLRKTLKAVYGQSPDLQALNAEVDSLPKNCRIQVLPINWRHRLDFPRTSLKHNKRELDISDVFGDENEYPNLEDITVDGVPAVRGLITDLALDILLYQSPIYRDHITRIVVDECNRIYELFSERNPTFKGRVSFVGHSLGSALMWDILCQQPSEESPLSKATPRRKGNNDVKLDFEVEDFFALGSPIGLFQMLQGRTIAARKPATRVASASFSSADPFSEDGLSGMPSRAADDIDASDMHISTPKCKQIFNIFHPTDPISYRIEPLISPAMSSLKPQPLPYTKRGIFGTPVGQGLSGIGTRVGQSVSGFWSSFSSGIASSLLNRSLGFSADDERQMRAQAAAQKSSAPLSFANTETGTASPPRDPIKATIDKAQDFQVRPGEDGEHPPTLLDTEIETLYAGFQRRRKSVQPDGGRDFGQSAEWEEAEKRARKLKQEETKVRALNSNGRVDYSIQEGAFDISLIAAVASHLSYWADEDVNHFMISQLLSRHRVLKRPTNP